MFKKLSWVATAWLLLMSLTVQAQGYKGLVQMDLVKAQKQGRFVEVSLDLKLDHLRLPATSMVRLTPVLETTDGRQEVLKDLAVLIGRRSRVVMYNRHKERYEKANGIPMLVHRHKNGKPQTLNLKWTYPYEAWMAGAKLSMLEQISGCADCEKSQRHYLIADKLFPEPYQPRYQVAYLTPAVEAVKVRSDRFVARFNFRVARHELLRELGNNAVEFARVDSILKDVLGNKDIVVKDVTIDGYASPEGGFDDNLKLSQRRARSFMDYLGRTYGLQPTMFQVEGHGEDWDGLQRLVAESQMPSKAEVLRLIETYTIANGREHRLMELEKGMPYRYMLDNFFPALRRTEYAFNYTVRAYSVDEAMEVYRQRPHLLSLHELYQVANRYPAGSKERVEVLSVAARLFPNDAVSQFNLHTARLQGLVEEASEAVFQGLQSPEAVNNLGVYYAQQGLVEKARACFSQIASSFAPAQANLAELERAIAP